MTNVGPLVPFMTHEKIMEVEVILTFPNLWYTMRADPSLVEALLEALLPKHSGADLCCGQQ